MKIAIASNDKINVEDHFGGSNIVVVTVEDGKIVNKELREKVGHNDYATEEHHPQTDASGKHGFGPKSGERHKSMFETFKDCQILISGMMGTGAYEYFNNAGLAVILTDVKNIDEAVSLYVEGKLEHKASRLD